MKIRNALVSLTLLLGGCTLGSDYVRPSIEVPADWGSVPEPARHLDAWWRQFDDPRLAALIEESLGFNQDLKAAAANVVAAAAALRLARADYLPTVNAGVEATRGEASAAGALPLPSSAFTEYAGGLFANYEIDIFGRIRRANEAALAELRADAAVRDGVRVSIAASVARAYFESVALQRRIALLERLHQTRTEDLRLQRKRLDAGVISAYDYEQAHSETAAIAAQLPALRAARSQTVTALAVLRGVSPQTMLSEWRADPAFPDVLPAAPDVPMDLPSALLERRPDVRAAEQRLIAANARIGQAKAAYFPSLSLTGFAGGVSTALFSLFDRDARSWEAGVALAQPLTDLNRAAASEDAARARYDAVAAGYARTVQVAFKETLDALSGVSSARDVMRAQDERVAALENAYRSAESRYGAGSIGYLELLDVERQLRRVEQQQVTARLGLLQATVDLYRALGGGWQGAEQLLGGAR